MGNKINNNINKPGRSKKFGNIGEISIIHEFVDRGIPVYIPFGDNEDADLVADFNGKLNKVQVKSRWTSRDKAYVDFDLTSTHYGTNKKIISSVYTKDKIDYFGLYDGVNDRTFLIPIEEVDGRLQKTLRYTSPKNNQISKVSFADDYTFDKVLGIDKLNPTDDIIESDNYIVSDTNADTNENCKIYDDCYNIII